MPSKSEPRAFAVPAKASNNLMNLLTTKEVSSHTGLSTSFFEKGRAYGYGPKFLRIRGKVLYRLEEINSWVLAHECDPKGGADV